MRTTLAAAVATVATVLVIGGVTAISGGGTSPSSVAKVLPNPGSGSTFTTLDARREPATPSREPFDRTAHSTTDPASVWVVVNKTHPIAPSDFRPEIQIVRGYQVATAAAGPLQRLLDAGDRRGLGFKIASAFRSYGYQLHVHAATAAARGDAEADLVSARAGYSEHQTGLAVDLVTPADPACDFDACFARTPGGRWLARTAWRFGFVVRYQPGDHGRHRLRARALAPSVRRATARRGAAPHRDRDPGGALRRTRRRLPDPVTQTAGRAGSPVSLSTESVTTSQRCSRIDPNMLVYA